jgi:glycosyltransferase involved in cell wall biosynthesis
VSGTAVAEPGLPVQGVSVLILTQDEEQDLPGCLDSVAWSDDVHVLDSGSRDRTVEIALERGATVTVRPFDSFAEQRNAGMALAFRHPWVLVLDADERPTAALSAEVQQVVQTTAPGLSGFRIRRRDYLWGTWLKHAQMSPYYVRLLRVGRVRYSRAINEVAEIDGDVGQLTGDLDHLAFSKGISHWVSKHNCYSSVEARLLADGEATRSASLRQALFGRDFHTRRVAQKALFYRMPLRPAIKWLYLMFVRGAFLDGHAGVVYAGLLTFYEYLIEVKRQERVRQGRAVSSCTEQV